MSSKLKAIRAGHRGAVTKLLKRVSGNVEELLKEYDVNEIISIREMIRKKETVISELNDKIVEEISEEDIQEEIEEADRYEFDIQITLTKLSKVIREADNTTEFTLSNNQINPTPVSFTPANNSSSTFSNSSMYHKLPKLTLPTFGGNILEWQPFWDSFCAAVHENLSLNDVQKFNYLRSQLNGEASQCISGLQITNTNYAQALNVLKQRFGQPHKIVNAYMQSLISLPSPSANIRELKNFYDSMENYIRGLEGMGQTHESYGSLLVPIILNKIPGNIRQNMVRIHGNDRWNLQLLRDAIQHEITIQEAGQSLNCYESESEYTPTSAFIASTNRNYDSKNRNLTSKPCIYCNDIHAPTACMKVKNLDDRKRTIKEKQLCFNCLGSHRIAHCKSKKTCKNCSKRHHTSICNLNEQHTQDKAKTETDNCKIVKPDSNHTVALATSIRAQVLLKTAISTVSSNENHSSQANILFDEGAQRSFITKDMADKLNLKPVRNEVITVSGFGETNTKVRHLQVATVYLRAETKELIPINVLIVPKIAHPIQTYSRNQSHFPYLKGFKLAHPVSRDEDFEVSILIGADYFWDIVEDKVIRGPGPTAVKSKVGYLLSGPIYQNSQNNTPSSSSILNILTPHRHEECEIHKFWEIESSGTEDNFEITKKSAQDEMISYQESSIYLEGNKYIAKFPWKPEHPELPSNEMIARKRTFSVINRLAKEPELLKLYGEIINEQEERGFIEKIKTSENNTTSRIHYIPHHPVKKDSLTTPIRIVYD
ncbi:uncharacterized protein LOC134698089 [Mytilus trossulus]|uniref:uncharacterized protein LOC134698089 n=1 Tax=Mytilus trossulus TaxID=6551 RepID=UPI0030075B69